MRVSVCSVTTLASQPRLAFARVMWGSGEGGGASRSGPGAADAAVVGAGTGGGGDEGSEGGASASRSSNYIRPLKTAAVATSTLQQQQQQSQLESLPAPILPPISDASPSWGAADIDEAVPAAAVAPHSHDLGGGGYSAHESPDHSSAWGVEGVDHDASGSDDSDVGDRDSEDAEMRSGDDDDDGGDEE